MIVGAWGVYCLFEVSRKRIYTYRDTTVSSESRWVQHDIVGDYPRMEYTGPGLLTISMTVDLLMEQGMKPRKIVDNLRRYSREGRTSLLVLGNQQISDNEFYLASVEEAWDRISLQGKLTKATVNLTFKETT